jgi:hypothetical protein
MALARVVTFDGVSQDRMDQMDREMREGEPPSREVAHAEAGKVVRHHTRPAGECAELSLVAATCEDPVHRAPIPEAGPRASVFPASTL